MNRLRRLYQWLFRIHIIPLAEGLLRPPTLSEAWNGRAKKYCRVCKAKPDEKCDAGLHS